MRIIRLPTLLLLVGLAAVSVGCDGGEATVEEQAQAEVGEPRPATPQEREVAPPTGTAVAAALTESAVDLVPDTVPPGPATIHVENRGDRARGLVVAGQGGEWMTDRIAPGEEAVLALDLEPGTYAVRPSVDGEDGDRGGQGTTATLVVRAQ